uniref:ANK_REP_REGION domain-containing protein n=1 Tax=Steinernema glaseri TaxID=37863 RepID=A0A1I8A4L3_9BILA
MAVITIQQQGRLRIESANYAQKVCDRDRRSPTSLRNLYTAYKSRSHAQETSFRQSNMCIHLGLAATFAVFEDSSASMENASASNHANVGAAVATMRTTAILMSTRNRVAIMASRMKVMTSRMEVTKMISRMALVVISHTEENARKDAISAQSSKSTIDISFAKVDIISSRSLNGESVDGGAGVRRFPKRSTSAASSLLEASVSDCPATNLTSAWCSWSKRAVKQNITTPTISAILWQKQNANAPSIPDHFPRLATQTQQNNMLIYDCCQPHYPIGVASCFRVFANMIAVGGRLPTWLCVLSVAFLLLGGTYGASDESGQARDRKAKSKDLTDKRDANGDNEIVAALVNISWGLSGEEAVEWNMLIEELNETSNNASFTSDEILVFCAAKIKTLFLKFPDLREKFLYFQIGSWGDFEGLFQVAIWINADFSQSVLIEVNGESELELAILKFEASISDVNEKAGLEMLRSEISETLNDASLSYEDKMANLSITFQSFFAMHAAWEDDVRGIDIDGFGPIGALIDVADQVLDRSPQRF